MAVMDSPLGAVQTATSNDRHTGSLPIHVVSIADHLMSMFVIFGALVDVLYIVVCGDVSDLCVLYGLVHLLLICIVPLASLYVDVSTPSSQHTS